MIQLYHASLEQLLGLFYLDTLSPGERFLVTHLGRYIYGYMRR